MKIAIAQVASVFLDGVGCIEKAVQAVREAAVLASALSQPILWGVMLMTIIIIGGGKFALDFQILKRQKPSSLS